MTCRTTGILSEIGDTRSFGEWKFSVIDVVIKIRLESKLVISVFVCLCARVCVPLREAIHPLLSTSHCWPMKVERHNSLNFDQKKMFFEVMIEKMIYNIV